MVEDKNLEERVTQIIIDPCDQGQHGISYCGHCNYSLSRDDSYKKCPKCDYRFAETRLARSSGGSDF